MEGGDQFSCKKPVLCHNVELLTGDVGERCQMCCDKDESDFSLFFKLVFPNRGDFQVGGFPEFS